MHTIKVTPDDNLQQILDGLTGPATICLSEGVYRQKVKIARSDVKIFGEKRETTVIEWDDYARKKHSDGLEYNTFRTYTVCVTGENVRLENFTIVNSNAEPEKVGQCVALSVNAKAFSARDMLLVSTQDTLFLSPFPDDLVARYSGVTDEGYYDGFIPRDELYMEGASLHCFEHCEIRGNVDFIFGCAEAYFRRCKLISLGDTRGCGYVAAPAHSLKQERGFVFADCDFVSGGAAPGSVFLARPWRDYGKCDFINCRCGSHINPGLFDRWNDTYRNRTARFAFSGLEGADLSPVSWSRNLPLNEADGLMRLCGNAMKRYGL